MKIVLFLVSLLIISGCTIFDADTWNHLGDPDHDFHTALQNKEKIEVGMSKTEVLAKWGKPHDIWASERDKEKGYENWNYYEILDQKDVLFNGNYFHRALRFKDKTLEQIKQEHISQDPKNLWVFDEGEQPDADVVPQLKAQGLI